VEILGKKSGLTFSHKALREQIEQGGWTVSKVKFDSTSGRYVVEAKNDSLGIKLERKGKTEQLALSNMLIATHHRASSVHIGRWNQVFTGEMEEIAQAYSKAPLYEPKASAAFMELAKDCERRVDVLSKHLQIQVVPDPEPYKTSEQLIKDVKEHQRLKISRAGADHPVWNEQQVVAYRICHDVFGYVASGAGWDWAGENEAFAFHAHLIPEEAQKALFVESIASAAYATYYRAYGQQKVALFPQFMDKAQETNNPYKGHPGVHPSQTVPAGAEAEVKPIVSATQDMPWLIVTGAVDPSLADPNLGWQSQHFEDPITGPNGLTIQEQHGDPLQSNAVADTARLLEREWAYLNQSDPAQLARMKTAIVNAFRTVILSPRKDLKWNAIHMQDLQTVSPDETDPKRFYDTINKAREDWNVARGHDRFGNVPYMKYLNRLTNTLYQRNPKAGFPAAQQEAKSTIFDWVREEQEKLAEQDPQGKKPDFQIQTAANYGVEERLKMYLAEHQPNLDKAMTKEHKRYFKESPINTEEFAPPTFERAAAEVPDLTNLQTPGPDVDVAKYQGFTNNHLVQMSQVGEHVDEILKAALTDVHQHDGTGHHFRATVMQLGIPGISNKTCSFAWLLLAPMTSELGTIDVHMMDVLGHDEKDMSIRDYYGYERMLQAGRDAAGYSHIPLGQFQWGCFVPGTLVRTRQGFRAIETIQQGDEVLTAQGNWKPVRKTMSKQHDGELVRLTTNGSAHSILTTDEHPFLTLKGDHKQGRRTPCRPAACADHDRDPKPYHRLDWTLAEDLKVGDWFPLTVNQDIHDCQSLIAPDQKRAFGPREFKLTPEFLWVCGFYIAEGSCEPNRVNFAMNGQEKDFQNRLIEFAESHKYGYDVRSEDGPNGGKCNIRINSGILAKWFPEMFGTGCHNKKIPAKLLSLPVEKLVHLVQGIYDGDGKKTTNAIEQTSSILALQLVEAASRLGAQPTTARYLEATSTYKSDVYRVHEPIEAKRSVRAKPDVWKMGDWDLRKITAIERIEYHGPVFNLSVEDDETYVVENIPVHNCWDYKRTGPGTHQDHQAIAVENPTDPMSKETHWHPNMYQTWWKPPEQQLDLSGMDLTKEKDQRSVEQIYKQAWRNDPPEWWAATKPAQQQAWDDWAASQQGKSTKNAIPFQGMPDGYQATPDGIQPLARVAGFSSVPWLIHPRSGEQLQGQPGQTIMQHAMGVLQAEDPRNVWSQLPDESVGKLSASLW
jgi:hypothetical protein